MTTNYNQKDVVGVTYQRCNRIILENPKDGVPCMSFVEEEVTLIPGKEIKTPLGQINLYYDPHGVFELINPITNQPLGQTVSQTQLQVFLYSLYIQSAKKRDDDAAAAAQKLADERAAEEQRRLQAIADEEAALAEQERLAAEEAARLEAQRLASVTPTPTETPAITPEVTPAPTEAPVATDEPTPAPTEQPIADPGVF